MFPHIHQTLAAQGVGCNLPGILGGGRGHRVRQGKVTAYEGVWNALTPTACLPRPLLTPLDE